MVYVPERTVKIVTSNSGNVVPWRRGPECDAGFMIAYAGTQERRRFHDPAMDTICADRGLFFFSQEICPTVQPIAQLPSGAVRAINEDAEWLRNGPGRGGHNFDQDRGLIELVDRNVVEVLGCDARSLEKPSR